MVLSGVGRNELIRRIIAKDPEKYRCPVPCKLFSTSKLFMY